VHIEVHCRALLWLAVRDVTFSRRHGRRQGDLTPSLDFLKEESKWKQGDLISPFFFQNQECMMARSSGKN
jgi:hypothetical protein